MIAIYSWNHQKLVNTSYMYHVVIYKLNMCNIAFVGITTETNIPGNTNESIPSTSDLQKG